VYQLHATCSHASEYNPNDRTRLRARIEAKSHNELGRGKKKEKKKGTCVQKQKGETKL